MHEDKKMIEVKKLNKYFGKLHVLKDVDLEVQESEVVCLIGASGSGKSTLLRCLNFLEIKQSGQISLEGKEINLKNEDLNKIRTRTGMVFQHFNLFPHMTVLENVIEAPVYVKKIKKEDAKKLGEEYLEKVGMSDKANVYPNTLSGGDRKSTR